MLSFTEGLDGINSVYTSMNLNIRLTREAFTLLNKKKSVKKTRSRKWSAKYVTQCIQGLVVVDLRRVFYM